MLRIAWNRVSCTIYRLQIGHQYRRKPSNMLLICRQLTVSPRNFNTITEDANEGMKDSDFVSKLINTDDLSGGDNLFNNDLKNISNKVISRKDASQVLHDELFISQPACEKLFEKEQGNLRSMNRVNFMKIIEMIKEYKITSESIEDIPFILGMPAHNVRAKLDMIKQMKPKKIDDFLPLIRISRFRLLKILHIMNAERELIPAGNRIYYLAEKLDLPAQKICKYLVARPFMLHIPFHSLMGTLEAMLEYGVSPASIIKDLWAFRYNTDMIKERLARAKKSHKTKIMPWMIRCPEIILQKSLRLASDEKKALGQNEDIYHYVSQRLGFSVDMTKAILMKHPPTSKIRITKIKEILDFLLDEAGFTRYDIAQVPRILSHGLETTKARLAELRSIGCEPNSLIIVCKSKREYQKFVDKWLETRNRIKMI